MFRDSKTAFRIQVAAALVVAALAISAQFRTAAIVWGGDLSSPDEPAHFVTGVMVHDYLHSPELTQPLEFAKRFYVRYPKVALGHWPPVYYAIQAAWYSVAGPSIAGARILSLAFALAIAILLLIKTNRMHGLLIGIVSAACLLALPLVRELSWTVNSSLLEALFVFLAVLAFTDYLKTYSAASAARFAGWSALAILTKGSAISLGIFAVIAPVIMGRLECLRRPAYWLSGLTVLVLTAPFYAITWWQSIGYADKPEQFVHGISDVHSRIRLLSPMLRFLPVGVAVTAIAAGILAVFGYWIWRRRNEQMPEELAAVAWLISQAAFLYVLPLTSEVRYFAAAIGPAMILFAGAAGRLESRLSQIRPELGCVAPLTLAALAFFGSSEPSLERLDGYAAAAHGIPSHDAGAIVLVSANAIGTGALIAARLEHDRFRRDVLLRHNKVLAHATWSGEHFQLLYQTPDQVEKYLQATGVQYIALDGTRTADPAQALLEKCLQARPDTYVPEGRYPIQSRLGTPSGNVTVFRNRDARAYAGPIEVNLGPSHGNQVFRLERDSGKGP